MKALVTGSAGFIGSAVTERLLKNNYQVVGVDNLNDYYDVNLKKARLSKIINEQNYTHYEIDISNKDSVDKVFYSENPDVVINLAAQAGVRYSIENPKVYIETNLVGFFNIIEASKNIEVKHLIYASSSSVYGANEKLPFSTLDNVSHPISLYAATKRSNELIAHSYSYIFDIPTTGLRFFTVYGPWGRPDMAIFDFTNKIINNKEITLYNYGNHSRDFTYIDDVVEAIDRLICKVPEKDVSWDGKNPNPSSSMKKWKIYNIGNHQPVKLLELIANIEEFVGKKANIKLAPLQLGDVPNTYADVEELYDQIGFKPNVGIADGIKKFVEWYRGYYSA